MNLLIFIAIILAIFALNKILEKILGVKEKKISNTNGRKVEQWGKGIISISFFSIILYILPEENIIKYYGMAFLFVFYGFQAILEWIYIKNSKQFLITIIMLMLGVILIYYIDVIFQF